MTNIPNFKWLEFIRLLLVVIVINYLVHEVFFIGVGAPEKLFSIEQPIQETFYKISISETHDKIVLVDIDERSVNSIGPWPWVRSEFASLLLKLSEAKPKLIIVPIEFSKINDNIENDPLVKLIIHSPQLFLFVNQPSTSINSICEYEKLDSVCSQVNLAKGEYGEIIGYNFLLNQRKKNYLSTLEGKLNLFTTEQNYSRDTFLGIHYLGYNPFLKISAVDALHGDQFYKIQGKVVILTSSFFSDEQPTPFGFITFGEAIAILTENWMQNNFLIVYPVATLLVSIPLGLVVIFSVLKHQFWPILVVLIIAVLICLVLWFQGVFISLVGVILMLIMDVLVGKTMAKINEKNN